MKILTTKFIKNFLDKMFIQKLRVKIDALLQRNGSFVYVQKGDAEEQKC